MEGEISPYSESRPSEDTSENSTLLCLLEGISSSCYSISSGAHLPKGRECLDLRRITSDRFISSKSHREVSTLSSVSKTFSSIQMDLRSLVSSSSEPISSSDSSTTHALEIALFSRFFPDRVRLSVSIIMSVSRFFRVLYLASSFRFFSLSS